MAQSHGEAGRAADRTGGQPGEDANPPQKRLDSRPAPTHIRARQPTSGPVAQLGERLVRNEEVVSSILIGSTNFLAILSGRV